MTFRQWLLGQRRRNDPVGDLARDAAADGEFPRRGSTVAPFHRHLTEKGACSGAHEALREAWSEYEVEP